MKKRGIKILSAVLVAVTILTMTTAVLAEGTEGERTAGDRVQDLKDAGQKLEMLFTQYAPDLLDDYISVKQEHTDFHLDRKAEHESFKEQIRGNLNAIIDAFVAGEISGEEAKAAIIEMRDNLTAYRDELSLIKDAKLAEREGLKAQRESLRLQIQGALAAEEVDTALMYSLMEQSLNLFKDHLALDYKYAAQIDELKAEYFPE